MRALYLLLGDPVAHSRSPAIHARAFELLGVDAVYAPSRVVDVPAAMRGLRALSVTGANVTIPHKQAVIGHLDHLDESARRIGAVNCILNRDGALRGYNTDREGLLRALGRSTGRAVVLGAGGSARAAVDALKPNVTIVNRTRETAEELAREMGVEAAGAEAVARAEVVVNCTSVGMREGEMPLDPATLQGTLVDLVYTGPTGDTALVRAARQRGLRVIDGIEILVRQAIASLEIWLDRPRLDELYPELRKAALS
ncbi:MAG TPA: shikimate dehydrogenase [Myxococcales bacterium]|jgi:shikimate dehydrogenase|nr:shikimate dehydrogenase [Myxococcales bacterium]